MTGLPLLSSASEVNHPTALSTVTIYRWDISTPISARLVTRLQGHRQCVESLAFSSDGVTVASGDQAGEMRVWNTRTGISAAQQAALVALGAVEE